VSSGHRPRKRFGQHFLVDEHAIHRIVGAVNPQPGQHIVEIGPGLGVLTREILPLVERMQVVELDRDIIPRLAKSCGHLGELQIFSHDALRFDFCSLRESGEPLRIIGNLPYNISTPLLFHLLEQKACITDMVFMLQKEVVDRLAAQPGTGSYGKLSVMIQYHCKVTQLFNVPPTAFDPPPKVESAVVRLIPYQQPPVEVHKAENLELLVSRAFAQRRKTLRNNLKGLLDDAQIVALEIDPACRAETLSLAEFARLANALI
jgi:16S rRNA (adenine1518-N6/adenine1519-N6)-dimethyltransferase